MPSDRPAARLGHVQVAALVSPIRQEIVDAVAAAGPSTVAQIAVWLGRSPDRLYYHLSALLKVGLLVEREPVRTGRRFGAVYDVPQRPMLMHPGGRAGPRAEGRRHRDRKSREMVARVVRSSLRLADRDFARSLADPSTTVEGPRRTLWGGRVKGWIDDSQLEEFNALMERAVAILRSGAPRAGAEARAFTFVVAPVRVARGAPESSPRTSTRRRRAQPTTEGHAPVAGPRRAIPQADRS